MKKNIVTLCLCLLALQGWAQAGYTPSPGNREAREQFQDNKFGIFLHWGIYSMLGQGEWVLNDKNLDHREYRKLAAGFYPSKFDAAGWVAAVKASGAKYICFTTRHHDGFSMWDTRYSDYNVVKATPFKRDIVKELADECKKQGINLHFYYSHLDWDRDDYPLGRTGQGTGRTLHENWETYYRFMNDQIAELVTRYDPDAIWFDGWWDQDQKPGFDWQLPGQYAMIHRLKPACLIGNNHHQAPFAGEDIQIFERDLPGENKAGFSGQAVIGQLPLETCETMNATWGYNIADQDYKPAETLIHYLVKAAGRNANLLLNIGPQPDGELPEAALGRLREMGRWMKTYGETIYGTRGGDVAPRDWGVTTRKGDTLYVHILNLQDKGLFLPLTAEKVKSAAVFKDGRPVKFLQDENGVVLEFPEVPSGVDYVVELTLE